MSRQYIEQPGKSSQGAVTTQISGILMKRPYGHQATKWSKRFFLIRDGYLLYYGENEKKEFDKGKCFNIHPKGVVPLGGCTITSTVEPGQKYALEISHPEFENSLLIAADTSASRERWMEMLRECGRVTWLNQRLGDNMIRHLESQGLQLCREKREYETRLEEESVALRDEMHKNDALERAAKVLEDEKREIGMIMEELHEEYEVVKRELEHTILTMRTLEVERQGMFTLNETLQKDLESLSLEKQITLKDLTEKEKMTKILSEENEKVSQSEEELRVSLRRIEERMRDIREEKLATERSIRRNAERREVLEEERENCSSTAEEIMSSLKQLVEEKEMTEQELKEEIIARVEAENRLRAAEASLSRLDRSLRDPSSYMERSVKNTMMNNVQTLKKFFEQLGHEGVRESSGDVLASAIYTHKGLVSRAKSVRVTTLRKSRCRTGDPQLFRLFSVAERGEERDRTGEREERVGESGEVVMRRGERGERRRESSSRSGSVAT